MRDYQNVDDLKRDFNDINKRVQGHKGSGGSINDPALVNDLTEFGNRIGTFVGSGTKSDREVGQGVGRNPDESSSEARR